MNRTIVIAALFVLSTSPCWADQIYTNVHLILKDSIEHREAHGILKGHFADSFTKQFKVETPLFVDAKVIQDFSGSDCKRLQVVYTKKSVPTTDGGRHDFVVTTKMNYCPDGRPPYEIANRVKP